MKDYISLTEYCKKYGLDRANTWRKIKAGRIPGAVQIGRAWVLPADAEAPIDSRVTNGHYRGWRKGAKRGQKKRAIMVDNGAEDNRRA